MERSAGKRRLAAGGLARELTCSGCAAGNLIRRASRRAVLSGATADPGASRWFVRPRQSAYDRNEMPRKLYLETFGCQMNVLDSELVLGQLRAHGYDSVEDREQADVIIYNTCSVR